MAGFDDVEYERDYPRETVCAKAEIVIDGDRQDCVISNISPSGAKLYVGRKANRGADVIIRLGEFGQFKATIAWCYGDEIGVRFNHDPAEMSNVLIGLAS